jgi:hypothetical protein
MSTLISPGPRSSSVVCVLIPQQPVGNLEPWEQGCQVLLSTLFIAQEP